MTLKNLEEKKYFSINDLVCQTKFSKSEIQFIYRDFKQVCICLIIFNFILMR
jgi:hypothetical protein